MNEQVINTGDPATDKQIAEEIKNGFAQAGMEVEIKPAPGGGLKIIAKPPVAVAGPAGQALKVEMPKPGTYELGGTEGYDLIAQVQAGDLAGTRALLRRDREAKDWQDLSFMAALVGKQCPTELLDGAITREPKAADLLLLRGAHLLGQAWAHRGTGTADEITDEGGAKMEECVRGAERDLKAAARLDPVDPTAPAFLIEVAMLGAGTPREAGGQAFALATQRANDHLEAHWRMTLYCAEKWGGSHEEQLAVARKAVSLVRPGGDLHACLFRAHIEVWFYHKVFEQNEEVAKAHLLRQDVRQEVNKAFDAWIQPNYQPKRSSIPLLHWAAFWAFALGDRARLKRVMPHIGQVQAAQPWYWLGEPTLMFTQALQQSMS